MIHGKVMLDDDTSVFEAFFSHPPRAGEYLWPQGEERDRIVAAHGTGAFIVKEIAHWCAPGLAPREGQQPIHSLAIYVEPIKTEIA